MDRDKIKCQVTSCNFGHMCLQKERDTNKPTPIERQKGKKDFKEESLVIRVYVKVRSILMYRESAVSSRHQQEAKCESTVSEVSWQ